MSSRIRPVRRDVVLLAVAALLCAALGARAWQAGDFVPSEQVPADSAVSFPVDI